MVSLNTSYANLRVLSNEKQRALERHDAARKNLHRITKTSKSNIEALFVQERSLFARANENFSFARMAFCSNNHKAAKTFSKTAKKCMHLLRKIVKERRLLVSRLNDAKDLHNVADRQHRDIKNKFSQVQQSCVQKRSQAVVLANVPEKYRDNVSIIGYKNGAINIYFGGKGTPAGPGHGHINLDPGGNVRYVRNPGAKHGSHNYAKRDSRPEKNDSC